MTLIIAGHVFELEQDLWGNTPIGNRSYLNTGVFLLSDSSISTDGGRQALDSNFPKIRRFQVMAREPQFYPDGSFNRYGPASNCGSVSIAFAGSTLTAGAVMARVAVLLEDLRVSCERSSPDGSLKYVLMTPTMPNPLTDQSVITTWADDTFTSADIAAISIHGAVVNCLRTAIEDTLEAKRLIATSMEQFRSWCAEFVAASWCPRSSTTQLRLFRPSETKDTDGLLHFTITQEDISADKLAVLGMRDEFETLAQDCFDLARQNRQPTFDAMSDFMTCSIEQYRTTTGLKEIGLPLCKLRLP